MQDLVQVHLRDITLIQVKLQVIKEDVQLESGLMVVIVFASVLHLGVIVLRLVCHIL